MALAGAADNARALCKAARWGDIVEIERLLATGADVNAGGDGGLTPLHWACVHGHAKAVALLLAVGAEIDARDYYGRTPLHKASRYGRARAAELLLRAGADRFAIDENGNTPADVASTGEVRAVLSPLVKAALA